MLWCNCFESLDSFAFLQVLLAQLSKDLNVVLEKSFSLRILHKLSKMNQTKKIPKKSDFYSSLSEKSITADNHIFAGNV